MSDPTLQAYRQRIEEHLELALTQPSAPPTLQEAMQYAVLNGGKRFRPLLIYSLNQALGGEESTLDNAACAIELIHCYSLVHDDLPAMDNDDWRRNKPSCHKQFDEATAILVGDTLQALAFSLLAQPQSKLNADQQLAMIRCLSTAAGATGMAGGQMLDLNPPKQAPSVHSLDQLHQMKTGALFQAAVELTCIANPSLKPSEHQSLQQLGATLGLAFQIQDDLLDEQTDQPDVSYPHLIGHHQAEKKLLTLYQQARETLNHLPHHSETLRLLLQQTLHHPASMTYS